MRLDRSFSLSLGAVTAHRTTPGSAPTVASVTPATGLANRKNTGIVVAGTGFDSSSDVRMGAVAAVDVVITSAIELICASALMAAGHHQVTVTTRGGASTDAVYWDATIAAVAAGIMSGLSGAAAGTTV